MKNIFFILFIIALSGCAGTSGTKTEDTLITADKKNSAPAILPKITKENAKQIAITFLRQQAYSDKYIISTDEVRVTNSYENWNVWFKHINWQTIKPGHGLVLVNKFTGKASWQPLR